MKTLLIVLLALLAALQYRLWFGDGSVQEVWRLAEESRATRAELLRLRGRNQALAAEVSDLKSGLDAIEERARTDLGMTDADETFYQFVLEGNVVTDALDGAGEPASEPGSSLPGLGTERAEGGRIVRDGAPSGG